VGRGGLFGAVLLTLLLLAFTFPSIARADYNVQLQGDTFKVAWTINVSQNITDYPPYAPVYPAGLNLFLTGSDLSAFRTALQAAVQQKVSSASVSDVAVRVSSSKPNTTCTISCPLQWFNATAQFAVHESVQTNTGIAKYDLSWMTARIDDDLQAGGVSINRLGEKYLAPALSPFARFVSTSSDRMVISVNGFAQIPCCYQADTDNVVLFDMSQLRTPVQDWPSAWSLDSQLDTWRSIESGGFSVSAVETFTEAGTTSGIAYVSDALVNAEISAPLGVRANANQLWVDLSGGFWDQLSLIIILSSVAALAATIIIDRRLAARTRARFKPKKK
jgi:hypothetical protein